MQREKYATYCLWSDRWVPTYSRLVLDNAKTDRASTRAIRPFVDKLGISQIILLSRQQIDEQAMPAFQLHVTQEDLEFCRANLYRYLNIIIPEDSKHINYRNVIDDYLGRNVNGRK
jgi:hypothetical protein